MKKTPIEVYDEFYRALAAAVALARREALEDAMTACRAEHLSDPQSEEDAIYDQAVTDCVCAIKDLSSNCAAEGKK